MENKDSIIVITGAAGFISSCLVQYFNDKGLTNLVLVDHFGSEDKKPNWQDKSFQEKIERDVFFTWLDETKPDINCIIHLGARTDTTEFDYSIHQELNVTYSQDIWNYCVDQNIPLVYASSAATYGNGEFGYDDNHQVIEKLVPLNPYGISKNEFDKWAVAQEKTPPNWTGLKFFNIYGPNEYHKGRMASVIWHAFNQITDKGQMKLFRSHNPQYKDGEQLRDFFYVKDLVKIIYWMTEKMIEGSWSEDKNGLYNLGTGKARSFYDLVLATFAGMDIKPDVAFIDMPVDIRDKYQYFTEANMDKIRAAGFSDEFYSLEKGVNDYVRNYLSKKTYY
jgi:ADP-L-glycero-D-manno-heptose 6-epimerase